VCPFCRKQVDVLGTGPAIDCPFCRAPFQLIDGVRLYQQGSDAQRARRLRPRHFANQPPAGDSDGTALVFGILGLLLCPILSLLAVSQGRPGSPGRTLGIVGLVLWGVAVAIAFVAR
jgi:hypothetical protein